MTIPCRSFQSDKDLHQVHMQYYWSGLPVYVKNYWKSCTTCSTPTCAPQTLQTSQATSNSWEALEFHIHGFHREAPCIFWLHLNSSHCWSSLQAVTLHPNSWYHYITSNLHNSLFYMSFPTRCPKPCHFWSQYRICIPLLLVLRTALAWASFNFWISSQRW